MGANPTLQKRSQAAGCQLHGRGERAKTCGGHGDGDSEGEHSPVNSRSGHKRNVDREAPNQKPLRPECNQNSPRSPERAQQETFHENQPKPGVWRRLPTRSESPFRRFWSQRATPPRVQKRKEPAHEKE